MKDELIKLIKDKVPNGEPLFLVIRGSHAYGTNIETSDIDYAGVYIQPIEDTLGLKYKEQINDDNNDIVIYEIKRFIQLLSVNNPTILELLNTPDDCILYKHPIFDKIIENRDKFITKICSNSFGGYAVEQIKKARGQNKKQNWDKRKIQKKDILDFIYIIEDKTIPFKTWTKTNSIDESKLGVVKLNNARNIFSLYYNKDIPYKGLIKRDKEGMVLSNELRLSSIPKGEKHIAIISYDKDAYSSYLKDWKSYQTWLTERNESRWIDVSSHNQKIDGKNMMHCVRLIETAKDIAEGKGIIVRRDNASELIDIRKGKVDLMTLIDKVELDIKDIDILFKNSNLPDKVDFDFINNLLIDIRKEYYKL